MKTSWLKIVFILLAIIVAFPLHAQTSAKKQGLLYKGEYTICLSRSQDLNTGNIVGNGQFDETQIIEIFENKVFINGVYCEYKSTNSKGERVYTGSQFGHVTVYVNSNYNIRYISESFYGGMVMKINVPIVKGRSLMQNNTSATTTEYQKPTQSNETNTSKEPKHGSYTKEVTCPLCHGDGKCSTCNGKHWYYGIAGAKITCPNCKPNGACSKCGGSGKITVTEWY